MFPFALCALSLVVGCYSNSDDYYRDDYYRDDYDRDNYRYNQDQENDCAIRSDFECFNKACISQSRICDGFRDCGEGEDEDRYNCDRNSNKNGGVFNSNSYSRNNYRYSNPRYGDGIFNDRYYDDLKFGVGRFNRYYDNDRYSNRRFRFGNYDRYNENDRYSSRRSGSGLSDLKSSGKSKDTKEEGLKLKFGKRGRDCTSLEIAAQTPGCSNE